MTNFQFAENCLVSQETPILEQTKMVVHLQLIIESLYDLNNKFYKAASEN